MLKFKDNMKELTRNNILVENIIKSVDPTRLFLYNKFFQIIKRKFKEVYGKAKFKEGDYREVVNIFENIIRKENLSDATPQIAVSDEPPAYATIVGEPPPYASVVSDIPSWSTEPYDRGVQYDDRFASTRPVAPLAPISLPSVPTKQVREQLARERIERAKELSSASSLIGVEPNTLAHTGLEEEQYRQLLAATSSLATKPEEPKFEYPPDLTPAAEARLAEAEPIDLVAALPALPSRSGRPPTSDTDNPYKMRKQDILARFSDAYAFKTGGGRGNELNSSVSGEAAKKELILNRLRYEGIIEPESFYQKPKEKVKIGEGVKQDKLPNKIQFGKIVINPNALYYQNTLVMTSNGVNHFTGYKNVKVSDDFVSIVMKILNGQNPSHKDLQKLDLREKELYDGLIHLAHLHKKVDHNLDETRKAMKHRFELLNGEIGAGNTNKALKKEITELVHKMAYAGMISHNQRNKFVKSL
jgi:hypothetical protein